MNFGRAFTYVTEDTEWFKKVIIAALVMLIPVVGPITVIGWALEITRRVINGEAETLPDWSNFGEYLSKGFQGFIINFVYLLPVYLISGCAQSLGPIMQSVGSSGSSDTMQMVASVVSIVTICLSCVMIAYELVIGFILPAALANYIVSGQISAGFRFSEIIALVRAAPSAYFMTLLGMILSGLLASLGLIACFIGVLFTAAYAYAVDAHLWGQAYNAAKAAQGTSSISTM